MTHQHPGLPHVPDLFLEKYGLGDMPVSEMARLRALLDSDDALRQRQLALQESDAAIREKYPPAHLAEGIRYRLAARRANSAAVRSRFSWPLCATATAALLLVIGIGSQLRRPGPTAPETGHAAGAGERIKGPRLAVFRKTADGSEALADGSTARAGDTIRLGYRAASHAYGVILSIDGRGTVTRHLPRSGNMAAALDGQHQVLLDSAYELDDAPKWECFYFVSARAPFDAAPVLDAARLVAGRSGGTRPAALALPGALEQSSLVLWKETRR